MSDLVRCTRLRAVLSATACATRHGARIPSGGGRGSIRFWPCGRCPEGARVLAELEAGGWQRPLDSLPAEVLEPDVRQARERWRLSFPAHAPPESDERDPLRTVAGMTPDDREAVVDSAGLG